MYVCVYVCVCVCVHSFIRATPPSPPPFPRPSIRETVAGVQPTLEQLRPFFNITVLHEDPPIWQFEDFLTAAEIDLCVREPLHIRPCHCALAIARLTTAHGYCTWLN